MEAIIAIGAILISVWFVATIGIAIFKTTNRKPSHGPAYALDPNGNLQHGAPGVAQVSQFSGIYNGQVDVGGNCLDGVCSASRRHRLTGANRDEEFFAAQEQFEDYPDPIVVKVLKPARPMALPATVQPMPERAPVALPEPVLALPEPKEELSIFDTYRDREGVYHVSGTRKE